MKKLVIDRNVWLRGEGSDRSKLARGADGKRCCVGIYLLSCGVGLTELLDRGEPRYSVLPKEADWLGKSRYESTQKLYDANDDQTITAEHREQRIAQVFQTQGVKVEFIN